MDAKIFPVRWHLYSFAACVFVLLFVASLLLSVPSRADEAGAQADSLEQQLNSAFADDSDSEVSSPDAARFDEWEPLFEEQSLETENMARWNDPAVKTVDWLRHFGLRHSSSDGRYIGKGVPLEGTSWLNRPYHADWFLGSLLGDELIADRVQQGNELIAGLRVGYDFDYYWGLDWRFGWSKPNADFGDPETTPQNGSYFISDIDLKYYPWGDAKVRPYYSLGTGLVRINFVDDEGRNNNVTLATMPFGAGVDFHQWPWLAWRLEVLDNLAFGADGVETLNNFSFVAGMEIRLGAKPQSYWPWRPTRRIW